MRYLFVFIIFFSFSTNASSYTVPRETTLLLVDALQPLTDSNRLAKFTALEYLHYRLGKDAELMRPHMAELEAIYADPVLTNEPKSSVAAVLLVLGSSLDKTDLRLNALRYSRSEDRPVMISTDGLIKSLAEETSGNDASKTLSALFENDMPLKWYNSYPQLSSFIDALQRLLPVSINQQSHITNIVRTRMKLAQRFEHDKEEEQKFSGVITIWDHSSEIEVAALLERFDKIICSIPPNTSAAEWRYTFIDKNNIHETGAVRDLVCHK